MTEEPRRFRLRLAILLPAYLVFAQLCAFLAALGSLAFRWDYSAPGFLEVFLVFSTIGTAGALARTAVVCLWHRIEVGPAGLRARPRDKQPIPWSAIQTARITRWSVLSYLELEVPGTRLERYPLYLADLTGFAEAVEHFAGETHPLSAALREWLEHDAE